MSTVTMSGNDTIMINNRILADLPDGDVAVLTFPNDIANVKTGKNGNSIFSLNESGRQADLVLRVMRGSADDKYLNGLLTQQLANFAGTVLLNGEFIKLLGDGQGNITRDTYITGGGVFVKRVEAKSNVEGDIEQNIATYRIKYTNAPRVMT
jgi:hypothetical protein